MTMESNQYWTRHEQEQYNKRMEDEHSRQNHRIGELEKQTAQNNKLLIAVEKLAVNMENMQKVQKEQGEHLEALESRDGETWRKVKWYILTAALGILVGYFFSQIGF